MPMAGRAPGPGQHWAGGHSSLGKHHSDTCGVSNAHSLGCSSGVPKEMATKTTIFPLLSFCELLSGELWQPWALDQEGETWKSVRSGDDFDSQSAHAMVSLCYGHSLINKREVLKFHILEEKFTSSSSFWWLDVTTLKYFRDCVLLSKSSSHRSYMWLYCARVAL